MLELLWQTYEKDSDEIFNLQREKSYAFAELLERRSNHLNICHIQLSAGNLFRVPTALLDITQCLPTLTFARSPLMIASDWTMFLPLRMMFWEPQRTLALETLFPLAVSMYSALLKGMSGNSIMRDSANALESQRICQEGICSIVIWTSCSWYPIKVQTCTWCALLKYT